MRRSVFVDPTHGAQIREMKTDLYYIRFTAFINSQQNHHELERSHSEPSGHFSKLWRC